MLVRSMHLLISLYIRRHSSQFRGAEDWVVHKTPRNFFANDSKLIDRLNGSRFQKEQSGTLNLQF